MQLGFFMAAAAVLALTPGPNTALTISRSVAQGRTAGALVLLGVELGFLVHLFAVAVGLTALLLAIPIAYTLLRVAGAGYLLYIAFRIVTDRKAFGVGARSAPERPWRLVGMGFLSNALNPKTAAFYFAIFPQFIDQQSGSIFLQSLVLGSLHIAVSTACNLVWVFGAGSVAVFLARRPACDRVRRWVFGTIIGAFAVKLLAEPRHAPT